MHAACLASCLWSGQAGSGRQSPHMSASCEWSHRYLGWENEFYVDKAMHTARLASCLWSGQANSGRQSPHMSASCEWSRRYLGWENGYILEVLSALYVRSGTSGASNTNWYFKYQLVLQIPIGTSNTNWYFKYQLVLQIPIGTSNTNWYYMLAAKNCKFTENQHNASY
jgi:hypothetical protein